MGVVAWRERRERPGADDRPNDTPGRPIGAIAFEIPHTGRTDTSMFYEDLLPECDDLEAPRPFGVHTLQVALGLAFRP